MKQISSIILTCAFIILYAVISTGDVTTHASTTSEASETINLTAGVVKDLTTVATQQTEPPTPLYAGITSVLSMSNVIPTKVNVTAGVTADLYGGLLDEVASVAKNNVDVVSASYEDGMIDYESNIIMGELVLEDSNIETNEEATTVETADTTETMNIIEPGRTETGAYIVTGRSFSTLEEWEFDLLCHLVTGEACGETDEAQIAVAQVVLNRMESSQFPNTLYDVIYQNNPVQFSPTVDGNINKTPDERCIANVKTALTDVFYPKEMLFFTSIGYTSGYTDYLKIDDMYFSLCYK